MDRDPTEHRRQVLRFIEGVMCDPIYPRSIEDALYAYNELGLWPDDVTVSAEQAIMCWRLVEALRKAKFPEELRM